MFYLEGNRLTLVHYCEAGNRPRLLARKSADQSKVEFDFVAVSGSRKPAYLRHFGFNIVDENHHTEDWTFLLAGDKTMRAHFDLKRRKDGVAPPTDK